ncbi:hypothetical protein AA313_de0209368 [Arthrobotrys entomopaga]|nr:hypothetical protein AA313_de0209368 [Arthrobotrys entomopaga]
MPRRRKSKATEDKKAVVANSSPESKSGKTPETETEQQVVKPEPEYYDDPEALQKAIEASTREEAAWTRVEPVQKQSHKQSSPPYRTQKGGFNAVFRTDSPVSTRPQVPKGQNVVKIRPKQVPVQRGQRRAAPRSAAPKNRTPEKKVQGNIDPKPATIKKENKRPQGKIGRTGVRKTPVPVFDSPEEFPSLGTPQLRNSPSISNDKKLTPSPTGNISVPDPQPIKAAGTPELSSPCAKPSRDRKNEASQETKSRTQIPVKQSCAPGIMVEDPTTVSLLEPSNEDDKTPRVVIPAIKATPIRPQETVKSNEQPETDTSPQTASSKQSSVLLLEDKIKFKALTKKERKAQRAAANANKPKLSIKERVALRRQSIGNKSEEPVATETNKDTESKVEKEVAQHEESELPSCKQKEITNNDNKEDAIPSQSTPEIHDENKIRESENDEIVISDRSDAGNYDLIAFGNASFVLSPNCSQKEVVGENSQEKPENESE